MDLENKNKCEFWSNVWITLLVSILLAIIGIWGSVIADQLIKNPLSKDVKIWGFYVLLIVFTFISFKRLRAQENKTLNAQKDLIEKSDSLEQTIRTLPPEGFLEQFSKMYGVAHTIYKNRIQNEEKATNVAEDLEFTEDSIRTLLSAILVLTSYFDRVKPDEQYGANIMVFTDGYKTSKKDEDVLKDLVFADEDVDTKKLKGVLRLENSLSANLQYGQISLDLDEDISPDEGIKEVKLSLPVPERIQSDALNKFRVLPGGPLAIAINKPNLYKDTATISKWMDEDGVFCPTIKKDVKDYFFNGAGKEIGSFCSLPLSCDGKAPSAVLNIHKNQAGLLSKSDQFGLYCDIMVPFIVLLSELLESWVSLKDKNNK